MTVGAAWRDGVRRVNAAPFVLAGMFAVTLLIALPLAIALRGMIEAHLGDSLTAAAVADGNDLDWWREFSSQASGLGTTFVPSIVGFSAVLDNLAGLLDNLPMAATVAGATAAWMIVWSITISMPIVVISGASSWPFLMKRKQQNSTMSPIATAARSPTITMIQNGALKR